MARRTIKERLFQALTQHKGYRQVNHNSTKYVALTKDGCSYLFIGKSGALRKGRTVTESFPAEMLKSELLKIVPE